MLYTTVVPDLRRRGACLRNQPPRPPMTERQGSLAAPCRRRVVAVVGLVATFVRLLSVFTLSIVTWFSTQSSVTKVRNPNVKQTMGRRDGHLHPRSASVKLPHLFNNLALVRSIGRLGAAFRGQLSVVFGIRLHRHAQPCLSGPTLGQRRMHTLLLFSSRFRSEDEDTEGLVY